STLLAAVSAAHPKIGDYPFTTLSPNLGVARVDDGSIILADIPGLIEGAHKGVGLGHEFLRHVERTRALVYLIDVSDPAPVATLAVLRQELLAYGQRLSDLPCTVVLNKIDLIDPEAIEELRDEVGEWTADNGAGGPHCISAVTGQGIDALRHVLRDLYRAALAATD
ncbi:MAG: GTPase, partial [Candidatus Latescibacteria bacterium]|nr:GTPase [Candidatus Latescibacterota bacterium]